MADAYGFTGLRLDAATGLLNAQNRWYNPATGLWETQDPLGLAGGSVQIDDHVGNDPTNLVDPSGLSWMPDPSQLNSGLAMGAAALGASLMSRGYNGAQLNQALQEFWRQNGVTLVDWQGPTDLGLQRPRRGRQAGGHAARTICGYRSGIAAMSKSFRASCPSLQ